MSKVASEPSPQHLRALERANAVRLARANLKRRIGNGDLSAADVFGECPWEAASMSVADVLMSQRRWGSHRCRKLLFGLRISETKTVGALTDRQRGELARRLQGGTEHSAAAPAAPAPARVAVPA